MTTLPARAASGGHRRARFLLRQPGQAQGCLEALAEGLHLTLLWIPPGSFQMGSPLTEPDRRDNEGPQRFVRLRGFFMGQTPITQAQWRAVMNSNPSRFSDQPDSGERPVERVSWDNAMRFCQRLSQRTGHHYTLPSEAQWEYACRAGTSTPFHVGDTITPELANYDGTFSYAGGPKGRYRKQTTPVGSFPANAWGLLDMHGNVWEWCLDHWHGSYKGPPSDGRAWLEGEGPNGDESGDRRRLLRGGSWGNHPRNCRSAGRIRRGPAYADYDVGFRVVCLPQDPSLNP